MIDANDHVGDESIKSAFEDIGLKEAILERHEEQHGYQATYSRGKDPIDGIFVSEQIQVEAAGYLPFGDSPSDHRGLWIKMKEEELFGYTMDKIEAPQARRLTLEDPQVVQRWIDIYKEYILSHRIIHRAYQLQTAIDQGQ